MNQNFKRKLMAGLLSACMIFQTAGIVPVYAAENAADNIVTFAGAEVYAVYDGSTFYAATAGAPTTATAEKITDKKTINHLYIKGASVPKELMFQITTLKTVTCADTVTEIVEFAFSGCTSLTSVAMPSVTTIGNQAFRLCEKLASVEMSSVTQIDGFAFQVCASLTSVAMPHATGIGKSAFSGCTGLTSAQLPKVTTIGDNAFSDCQKLASLTLGETPPTVAAADAFTGCFTPRTLTIPGSLDSQAVAVVKYKAVNDGNTGDELWYGWTLPSITPSAGTLEITAGNVAPTYGTNNIITLTATFDKATNIGKQRASTINQVEFKDGATVLGNANATQNVNGKWVATLNVNTKNWAVGAHNLTATFAGNEELVGSTTKEVTVTVNESYAVYDGSKFCRATKENPSTATSAEITDKKTINHLYIIGESVPRDLMNSCTVLTSVKAPSIATIGTYAFSGCTTLASLTLGATPPTVGADAFTGCPTPRTLTIQCTLDSQADAVAKYKAVNDGVTDELWHGWTLPETINEVYAVYDGSSKKFYAATQAAPSTATATVISDKNTIHHLYIMGESVPDALMGDSGVSANTTLKTVTCANTVASIGNRAFYQCKALTSVEIPSATTIGKYAFYTCAGLKSVELPNAISIGINAFSYCTSLTSAKLPQVTSISDAAFDGCAKLASVEMPGATSIGKNAFLNCTSLISAKMPNAASISDLAFRNCTSLTSVEMSSATTIGFQTFLDCKALTSISLPIATTIGVDTFFGCTKLASVEMPKVTTIGDQAFHGTALTSVSLPSATTIGINAFEGCTGLTSVAMPKVTKIVSYAFNGCTGLASLTLGATPPTVAAADAFTGCPTSRTLTIQCTPDSQVDAVAKYKAVNDGNPADELWYGWTLPETINEVYAVYDGSKFCAATKADPSTATSEEISDKNTINHLYIKGESVPEIFIGDWNGTENTTLKTVTCADTVTKIGNRAFYVCNELTSVAMPKVTSIGDYAFHSCTKLASVAMPSAISIGDRAFYGCNGLTSVEMPCATSIGDRAFYKCTGLASVKMPNVTSIGTYAFYNCAKLASVEMSKVTSIGEQAFYGCASLTSANLPNATTIAFQAFYGCAKLASVQLPKVTSIREKAFYGCESLESISLPEAISLDSRVFSGCAKLASVQLPKVTTIGLEAFYNCTTLASLTLGATPPTVGNDAFLSCLKTNGLTIQGNPAFKDTVLADYNTAAGNDDNTTDNKWYGWTLPTSLNGTGLSNSEGKLTAAGSVAVNYGTDNTITFTASFAKVGENKLRTLAENQISLLNGGTAVESKAAILTDGVYSATFTVQTNDFTVGTYSYTATFDGNRSLVGGTATETVTVTINKIDQVALSIGGVPNKVTYGDSNFTLSTTGGSGNGAVTYAVTAGNAVSVVGSTGVVTVLNAGTATITATKAGDTNYNAKTGTAQVTVAPATPTLTWSNAIQTATYTGSAAVITAPTATGVTGGATPTGTISYTYEKKSVSSLFTTPENGLPVNAGTYTVTAHIAAEGNYTAADSATMELTIEKSTPTLAIGAGYIGKTYDGMAVTNPTVENMTISGVAYAAVTFAYSKNGDMSGSTTNAPKDAGTYYVQASVVAGDNTNTASSTAVSFTIAQAALTVTGGTVTQRQYNGGTGAAVTALTLNGLANGETLALTTDYTVGSPVYNDANAGTNKTVTGTATLVSNAKTGNYTLTGAYTITGQTISKATGLAAPTDGAMDDTANTFTFTPVTNYADVTAYEYSVDGGTTWTNVSANPISVGNVAGTIKIRIKETTNYEAGAVYTHSAAFTATLEGTVAISGTATYGETLTATVTDTQDGAVISYKWLAGTTELQSGTSNTLKIPGSAVGKTITVEVTGADYDGKLTAAPTDVVAKKAVTATAGAVSKVYNGQTAATVSLSIDKANEGDEITITAPSAVYNDKNVGTNKAITLGALTITGAAAGWYIVTAPISVTGTITAKPVTVKADDKSMTTGGTLPAFTVTYTGFVGTENDSNAALTTPAVAACSADGKTAGTFDITLSTQAVLNDTIGKNYTIASQTKGTLTVSSPSSGGGTVTPPAPKPEPPKTDPGTGNTEVSVPVKPVTKGDTSSATVPETAVSDAIAAAEKEAAKTGGSSSVTVTVDAPEGAKTVETTLPSKSLSAVADGKTEGLKISTPVADLSFDSEALKNIAGMAGKDVKISATQVDTTALTDAQKSQVGDAPVFDFTVTSGDKTISNFNGGTATVSVPYTPKEGENPEFVTVWLLDDAGKLIPIEASYKDGKISFETGHFSRYAIGYLPFTDVKADWAYESIVYVYQNKLFSGVGDDKFAPTANMNRAMLWTVLYRMAGSPNQTETPANWYADAQAWAIAEKISDGTNPDGNITREQLATILFRYAKAAATAADMSGFTDTNEISSFAKDGISWAVKSKILQGNCGKLEPQGNATRAEVAAVLSRYVELVIDKATA